MDMNDPAIAWMNLKAMSACTCGHLRWSHRPMSRACSGCACSAFTLPAPAETTNGQVLASQNTGHNER